MGALWISKDAVGEILDKARARELLMAFGGQAVYLPIRPKEEHIIARRCGMNTLEKLCASLGGIYVAFANPYCRVPRKDTILRQLKQGKSPAEVARRCGVTLRYVQRLRKTLEAAPSCKY